MQKYRQNQWRMQTFPDEGANLLFGKLFADKCLKMKEFRRGGGSIPSTPLDPPMKTTFAMKSRTKQYGHVGRSCNLSILCETFLLM